MPPADTLAGDLIDHLYATLHAMPPAERRRAHWVMNDEWYHECRKAAMELGYTPISTADLLIGKPIKIRADGGVPHLET